MIRRLLAAALLALAACDGPPAPIRVTVEGDTQSLVFSPEQAITSARRMPFGAVLEIDPERAPRTLTVAAPNTCPVEVSLEGARAGDGKHVVLRPWMTIGGGDLAQLGFDAPFALSVEPGCRDALAGKIEWKQVRGAPVKLEVSRNGFSVRGRTPKLAAPAVHGIVPLSPRTRGELVLEARWRGGGRDLVQTVRLAAATRATGLPSVAPGQRVWLGGQGWRVRESPRGGKARIDDRAETLAFMPDARGRWVLEDAAGARLSIAVGTHADAPLDCGRSDCHAAAARHAQSSPMTTIFSRGLRGELPGWEPGCVDGCHSVGEPGIDDAGFSDVQRELGWYSLPAPAPNAWSSLARPLRRLAGVGCTSCHGPGAIPEPSASWAVLRSDVCATCHDAPPRYPHVAQWITTRMSRADAEPETRARDECRGCHTTAGFVGRPAAPEHAIGIGCAACHAPHAREHGEKLLRLPPMPAGFPELPPSAAPSRVCVACHASPKDALPRASAATILFGAPHPHAALPGGCIGCHGAPRDARGRVDHGFRIDPLTCKSCHTVDAVEKPVSGANVRERAERLLVRIGRRKSDEPPHASTDGDVGEAERLVLLVLEDPAAAMHNAPHARSLLDQAERLIAAQK